MHRNIVSTLAIVLAAAGCGGGAFVAGPSSQQADSGEGADVADGQAHDDDAGQAADGGATDAAPWVLCTFSLGPDAGDVQFGCGAGHVVEPDGAGPFTLQLSGTDGQGHVYAAGSCASVLPTQPTRCASLQSNGCNLELQGLPPDWLQYPYNHPGGTCEQQ